MLHNCWTFDANGRDYTSEANRLKTVVNTAKSHIKSIFKTKKGTDMTADDVFQIVAAMILAENIRAKDPTIYNRLIDQLDSCLDAESVAHQAIFYKDRLTSDNGGSFHGAADKSDKKKATRKR